jgi:hypothetical protein
MRIGGRSRGSGSVKTGADVAQVEVGRELLRRIAAMLTALSKVAAHA